MKTKRRLIAWVNNVTSVLLMMLLIFVVGIVIYSNISGGERTVFGYQLLTVLSGSMEPGIMTGSVIAAKTGGDMNRFKENDVITFKTGENILVTHRILRVIHNGNQVLYETKGDNNDGPDVQPIISQNVVAEYSGFTVPYVGYILHFLQSKNHAWLLLIPGFLLSVYSVTLVSKALSDVGREKKQGQA